MKLIALFLIIPILSFSRPTDNNDGLVHPEAIKAGTHIKTMSKFLGTKSTKLSEGKVAHNLKLKSIGMDNVILQDAFLVADKGIVTSLSLMFDKKNGEAFLTGIIKKYGMPFGEMIDVYEWKSNNNVIFEIHETNAGFIATYKPLQPKVLVKLMKDTKTK